MYMYSYTVHKFVLLSTTQIYFSTAQAQIMQFAKLAYLQQLLF